jgi:carbamoylphosphate synthase large subunit
MENRTKTPAVLLITSCRWFATARIAIAFAEAGCQVDMVCPQGHPVTKAQVIHHQFTYHGLRPLPGIEAAIEKSKPLLVVPCDDRATADLLRLSRQTESAAVKESIHHALGTPENYSALEARNVFIRIVRDGGVCAPETARVENIDALDSWLSTYGFPAYLKVDGTSGGVGVAKICDRREAKQAFDRLSAPPAAIRVAKRLIVDRDTSFVMPFLRRARSVMNIQRAVTGTETNSAIACWQGQLLASVHVQVLERRETAGHATVIRVIENQHMQETAQKVASLLGLSGIFGLDYIVEAETGLAHLIEMNARATQTCHLQLGVGRSPIAALSAMMAGRSLQEIPAVIRQDTIALFPQEWKRNPASPYLQNSFHDVPWAYPALIRSSVKWRLQDQESFSYKKWLQRKGKSH